MKKTNQWIKYAVVMVFAVASILSVFAMKKVGINYNISDYLDKNTETKIALEIIETEFGTTGDIQLMIENVDVETAESVCDIIKSVPNVLTVKFDKQSENYYREGKALFTVIVDGDNYSEEANTVLSDIKAELDGKYQTNYGGTVAEKNALREAMQTEIFYILGVALVLAAIIMLLTSKSWLSPVILLLASGVAVLLNMGTNIIFGDISYITNAVAAILQLALSVDYSIVLQHAFREQKLTEEDNDKAMMRAIKSVVKPVSASALTTIAGLLALLFMSFRIGFDIGIVLMKGIMFSAITALTLYPVFLLVFDKIIIKTAKKSVSLTGEKISEIAFKGSRIVVPIALLLIVACGIFNFENEFTFTDSKNANQAIISHFDQNNTVIAVYPHGESDYENEKILADRLATYKTEEGSSVLKNYTAYTNTVREPYDMEKAATAFNLSEDAIEMLFGMYYYDESSFVDMSGLEFITCADSLAENYTDDKKLQDSIRSLLSINEISNGSYTANEFYELIRTGIMDGTDLSQFQINQMYGLYSYEYLENSHVEFESILDFMVNTVVEHEEAGTMFDTQTVANLKALAAGIDEFNSKMETALTQADFRGIMYNNHGMIINETVAAQLYAKYFASIGNEVGETISYLDLMKFLVSVGQITDRTATATIVAYDGLYSTIHNSYPYEQFVPVLTQVATGLTGSAPAINVNDLVVQQLYILYFCDHDLMPDTTINGRDFIRFVAQASDNNPIIGSQFSEESRAKLADLGIVDAFLCDDTTYTATEMPAKLTELQSSLQSTSVAFSIGDEIIDSVFIRHAIDAGKLSLDPIAAVDLLDYVSEHKDSNELLKSRISGEVQEKLDAARDEIDQATDLFIGENYSRILLSVGLPNESEESFDFIEFLSAEVKTIFGEDAHIAGEMVSTYDLQETFGEDNKFISIFTIISIFLIVMFVFRSLSLPVVLVAVIQGAIWISMSSSLLTGPMFFMSYLMATCILMGATIDYGILMSTTYVQERGANDKKAALYKAVAVALPTVLVSGLILIICGFVVGIIASQTSISAVGILLGKGTLVSVLMVTFVLPSVLYLLDGFILKFSMKKKTSA